MVQVIRVLGQGHLTLARHLGTIALSCFTTRGSGKEHGTNEPAPTGRVCERSKGDTHMSDHLPGSFSLASIWAEEGLHHRKDSESE